MEWKQLGKVVQIPAGNTLLEADYNFVTGNTRYIGKGVIFQYNFQAGKHYFMTVSRDDKTNDVGVSVFVYDIGEKIGVMFKPETFDGFAPFLNVAGNSTTGTMVLE